MKGSIFAKKSAFKASCNAPRVADVMNDFLRCQHGLRDFLRGQNETLEIGFTGAAFVSCSKKIDPGGVELIRLIF